MHELLKILVQNLEQWEDQVLSVILILWLFPVVVSSANPLSAPTSNFKCIHISPLAVNLARSIVGAEVLVSNCITKEFEPGVGVVAKNEIDPAMTALCKSPYVL